MDRRTCRAPVQRPWVLCGSHTALLEAFTGTSERRRPPPEQLEHGGGHLNVPHCSCGVLKWFQQTPSCREGLSPVILCSGLRRQGQEHTVATACHSPSTGGNKAHSYYVPLLARGRELAPVIPWGPSVLGFCMLHMWLMGPAEICGCKGSGHFKRSTQAPPQEGTTFMQKITWISCFSLHLEGDAGTAGQVLQVPP